MPQDYKHRAGLPRKNGRANNKPAKKPSPRKKQVKPRAKVRAPEVEQVSVWRWLLVFVLVGIFAYFLYQVSISGDPAKEVKSVKPIRQEVRRIELKKTPLKVIKPVAKKAAVKQKEEVQFDFYRVLPEKEFVVPDYELKTRKREERVGKVKAGVQYSVQAGAFRHNADADSLKAKLTLMGFSPNIEKAPVKSVIWYRVKMGPYQRTASVDAIVSRLKENGMDALVIEVRK